MRSARIGARAARVWCPCPAQATKECLLDVLRRETSRLKRDIRWGMERRGGRKGMMRVISRIFFSLESFVVLDTEVWYLLFIVSSMLDIFLKVDIIIVGT